jgi:hypothetical protein
LITVPPFANRDGEMKVEMDKRDAKAEMDKRDAGGLVKAELIDCRT